MTQTAAAAAKPQAIPTSELLRLVLNAPLYHQIEVVGDDTNHQLKELRIFQGKFDSYCPICQKQTTWTPRVSTSLLQTAQAEKLSGMSVTGHGNTRVTSWTGKFQLQTYCARNEHHVADYYLQTRMPRPSAPGESSPLYIIKVGQSPSLTDFQLGDLAEIEAGMSKDQRKEFVRAINTSAHGFHVAACVHLRRIFENVLVEARDAYMAAQGLVEWPEFASSRTDERIRLLRNQLPQFMSEHPEIYGLLSIGVHELTEEQCADEFPTLRKAIELIMRDRLIAIQQKREREDVAKLVARSVDRHKK